MSYTIGVLVVDLEGAYSQMIWPEVARFTKSQGADLIILPANNPDHPYDFRYQFNHLYNFLNKNVLDVLIFTPSVITNFVSKKKAEELISRIMESVPVICLNDKLPGSPSLNIDNTKGIMESVEHLYKTHGFEKIGFIQGPPGNKEAVLRRGAYLQGMKQCGLEVRDEWLFDGNFTTERGRILGRENGREIVKNLDAVIAANDFTAIGFIEALQQQNYSIPQDIAVIGFDDINEAPFLKTPLTTIRQPFTDLVEKAADMALRYCRGESLPMETVFETRLVIRASCGCQHYLCDSISDELAGRESQRESFLEYLKVKYPSFIKQRLTDSLSELMSFLLQENVDENSSRVFLNRLESTMDREFLLDDSGLNWSEILLHFYKYLEVQSKEIAGRWQAERLFERCQILIHRKAILKERANSYYRRERLILPLRDMQQQMAMSVNPADLFGMLEQSLPALGIRNCFITLLKEGIKKRGLVTTVEENSQLVFQFENGRLNKQIAIDTGLDFATLALLPDNVLPEPSGLVWTIGPLFNRDVL